MIKHSKLQISLYSKKHCIYIFAKLQGREVSEDFHWAAGERVFNPNKNDIFEICFFWGGGGGRGGGQFDQFELLSNKEKGNGKKSKNC